MLDIRVSRKKLSWYRLFSLGRIHYFLLSLSSSLAKRRAPVLLR